MPLTQSHTEILHDSIMTIASLRLAVAIQGEHASPPWWQTKFYSEASDSFLKPIFPRSLLLAKIQGCTEAAARIHDKSTGQRSYHLFRLPSSIEEQLARIYQDPSSIEDSSSLPNSRDTAAEFHAARATDSVPPDSGAVNMGSIENLLVESTLTSLISLYHHAFKSETPTFPFFTANK